MAGKRYKNIDHVIRSLEMAQEVGAPEADIRAHAEKVKTVLSEELQLLLGGDRKEHGKILKALDRALRAGLPQADHDSMKAQLLEQAANRLASATSAVQASGAPSPGAYAELADAMRMGQACNVAPRSMEEARQAFKAAGDAALDRKDLAGIVAAFDAAGSAAAKQSDMVSRWAKSIKELLTIPAMNKDDRDGTRTRKALSSIRKAEDLGIPADSQEIMAAKTTAVSMAGRMLDEKMAVEASGLDGFRPQVEAWQLAQTAGAANVATYASTLRDRVTAELRSYASSGATDEVTGTQINKAFYFAEVLGVSAEEMDSARTAILAPSKQRLEAASMAIQAGRSPEKFQELAKALRQARISGVPDNELASTRAVYVEQADEAYAAKELSNVEAAVRHAPDAGKNAKKEWYNWANSVQKLRSMGGWTEDSKDNSRSSSLVAALKEAKVVGLPQCSELDTAIATAQTLTHKRLEDSLADTDPNKEMKRVVEALIKAREADVDASKLAGSEAEVQRRCLAELDTMLAGDRTQLSGSRLAKAFENAAIAGVPQERLDTMQASLVDPAKQKLQDASEALSQSLTADNFAKLAGALKEARACNVKNRDMTAAGALYRERSEDACNTNDMALVEAAVKSAAGGVAGVSPRAREWAKCAEELRMMTTWTADQVGRFNDMKVKLQRAKKSEVPLPDLIAQAEAIARDMSLKSIEKTAASENLKALQTSIGVAESLGVSEDLLQEAKAEAKRRKDEL